MSGYLSGSGYVLEGLSADTALGRIIVEIDRVDGVDTDYCAGLNKYLVEQLETHYPEANYSVEVGSVSLSDPFRSIVQYKKHLGDNVVVVSRDGEHYSGCLVEVREDGFVVDKGERISFRYDEVLKTTCPVIV